MHFFRCFCGLKLRSYVFVSIQAIVVHQLEELTLTTDDALPATNRITTSGDSSNTLASVVASATTVSDTALTKTPLKKGRKSRGGDRLRGEERTDLPGDHPPQEKALLIEVVSTPDRGLAVFAAQRIKAGTLILAEKPLISLDKDEEDDPRAVEREFSRLSRQQQKLYLGLFDAEKSRMSTVASIYYSNCYNCDGFKVGKAGGVEDGGQQQRRIGGGGSAVGLLSSRINHSCVPNVQFWYDEVSDEMRFRAVRDIPRGRELCSSYDRSGAFETAVQRRRKLQIYYGFVCRCEACEPLTEFWARSDERRRDMHDVFRALQGWDRQFAEGKDKKLVVCAAALAALVKLEALLLKEGLVGGAALANTYRSMAKWAERGGDTPAAFKWKTRELQVCVVSFGPDARRTRDIQVRLAEWAGLANDKTIAIANGSKTRSS